LAVADQGVEFGFDTAEAVEEFALESGIEQGDEDWGCFGGFGYRHRKASKASPQRTLRMQEGHEGKSEA
jgi:hypothetical protein